MRPFLALPPSCTNGATGANGAGCANGDESEESWDSSFPPLVFLRKDTIFNLFSEVVFIERLHASSVANNNAVVSALAVKEPPLVFVVPFTFCGAISNLYITYTF